MMKETLHRRGFLKAAGLAAAGSLAVDLRAGARPAEGGGIPVPGCSRAAAPTRTESTSGPVK